MSGRGNDRTDPEDYGDVNDAWMSRDYAIKQELKRTALYKEEVSDPVKFPAHYTKWKIQPRDFAQANNLAFWQGSTLKYIMRAGDKPYEGKTKQESELIDLRKAQEFIESRIKFVEEGYKADLYYQGDD